MGSIPSLAKVGVEGSNPFTRSRFSQENEAVKSGPSGPLLLTQWRVAANVSSL